MSVTTRLTSMLDLRQHRKTRSHREEGASSQSSPNIFKTIFSKRQASSLRRARVADVQSTPTNSKPAKTFLDLPDIARTRIYELVASSVPIDYPSEPFLTSHGAGKQWYEHAVPLSQTSRQIRREYLKSYYERRTLSIAFSNQYGGYSHAEEWLQVFGDERLSNIQTINISVGGVTLQVTFANSQQTSMATKEAEEDLEEEDYISMIWSGVSSWMPFSLQQDCRVWLIKPEKMHEQCRTAVKMGLRRGSSDPGYLSRGAIDLLGGIMQRYDNDFLVSKAAWWNDRWEREFSAKFDTRDDS